RVSRRILKNFEIDYGGLIALRTEYHFDHFAFNGDELISEPYSLTLAQLKKIIERCEEKGLTFYITGRSYHFPGETLRVVFTKVKKKLMSDKPTSQELVNSIRHMLYLRKKGGCNTIQIEDIETIVGKVART
ncbi:unnamed protein product, partial [marine sediment metagenome]